MKKPFKDQKILYIPIVSMRSYETGKYNLDSDGNINRAASFFSENPLGKPAAATIILPSNCEGKSYKEALESAGLTLDFGEYPENAKATREDDVVLYNRAIKVLGDIHGNAPYDWIIVESPALFKKLRRTLMLGHKFAFWNPVSKTMNMTPSFMSEDAIVDLDVVSTQADLLIVATKAQAEYYKQLEKDSFVFSNFVQKKNVVYDKSEVANIKEFFGRQMFRGPWKKFFFPFRLTDKGYRFKETVDCLYEKGEPFVIFFSDPNDSKIINDEWKSKYDNTRALFVKVPTDRKTVYSFMKAFPCIYNECYDIHHASLEEIKILHGFYYRLSDDNLSINISRRFA